MRNSNNCTSHREFTVGEGKEAVLAAPACPVHFAFEDLRQPQVRQPNVPCSCQNVRRKTSGALCILPPSLLTCTELYEYCICRSITQHVGRPAFTLHPRHCWVGSTGRDSFDTTHGRSTDTAALLLLRFRSGKAHMHSPCESNSTFSGLRSR